MRLGLDSEGFTQSVTYVTWCDVLGYGYALLRVGMGVSV